MNKEDNYDAIRDYMVKNYDEFYEEQFFKIIYRNISSAKKYKFRNISPVKITKAEMDKIIGLNDIKKEKIAVKEIIERELARGGQVFYLNNKIERLPVIANEISKLVKNAKIAIAHGKLTVEQMEDIMQRFINNEFNVLLCTTIIENGIDIPNVNTIIVENADCFGLSQLYQIKGRVGRSNKLAYAYLMYNANKDLSDIAKKRLQTIKEFTALGSGYKVAMRDLITRGAGDLLGPEQSGFIETVGIDMYIEMLHSAIDKKKLETEGKQVEKVEKVTFNRMLNVDAYIPQKYFNNDFEKIEAIRKGGCLCSKRLKRLSALTSGR